MSENHDIETEESYILEELHDQPAPTSALGYIGLSLIEIPLILSIILWKNYPIESILMVVIGCGLGITILVYPNIIKWKVVAGKMYFDCHTFIGDDDIYEQIETTSIIDCVAAAEPFPFAEYCFEEEDITEYLSQVGGRSEIEADVIQNKINLEIAKRAAEHVANPSITGAIKAKWYNWRNKGKDTTEYHLEGDELVKGAPILEDEDDE